MWNWVTGYTMFKDSATEWALSLKPCSLLLVLTVRAVIIIFLGWMSLSLKSDCQQFFKEIYYLPSGNGCSCQHFTVHIQQQNHIFFPWAFIRFNSSTFTYWQADERPSRKNLMPYFNCQKSQYHSVGSRTSFEEKKKLIYVPSKPLSL